LLEETHKKKWFDFSHVNWDVYANAMNKLKLLSLENINTREMSELREETINMIVENIKTNLNNLRR
jgi:hypothetical protein